MNERKAFLLMLIGALAFLTFLMLEPFLVYILGSIILAFVLHPLYMKIKDLTGEKLGAGLMVFLAIFAAIMPVAMTTAFVLEDAKQVAADFSDIQTFNVSRLEDRVYELTGQEIDVENTMRRAVRGVVSTTAGNVSQVLGLITDLLIGLSVMLFLLYYMVRDGESFVKWIKSIIPMPEDFTNSLAERIEQTTWAVIKGHVLIAVLQGLVAGFGLFLAGVPNYFFWTFIMVVLSFIPLIGSGLIWLPAVIYLLALNRFGAAAFLLLYSSIVVGMTDNFLRPLMVDEEADIHPAAILVGVIGGVFLLGAPGLFIGPIIFGVFKSTLMVFESNYEDL